MYDIEERRKNKMNSDDRILILKPVEGKKVTDAAGKFDPRLFTGENKLHAVFDTRTGMWNMKYEMGTLPGALHQKFVEFHELLDFAKAYYKQRNVEVSEVV